ncbi:MAG: hypothetical protein J6U54_11230 [Clostridiales bacterium]|nr:hypothetical protein [Clostridiales bacterium]
MKLVELMDKYWETHEAVSEEEGYSWLEPNDEDGIEMMKAIWDDDNGLFIGSHFRSEVLQAVRQAGYFVRVTERDSFGILMVMIGKDGKYLSVG